MVRLGHAGGGGELPVGVLCIGLGGLGWGCKGMGNLSPEASSTHSLSQ